MNELDPTQTEAVRRALAAARHDRPMPSEVAARLDATLADLLAEQDQPAVAAAMVAPAAADVPDLPDEGATVLPFRRRRWPALLAAAAAVFAVGVATPTVVDHLDSPGASTASDAERSDLKSGDADSNAAGSGSADEAPAPMATALGQSPGTQGELLSGAAALAQLDPAVRAALGERGVDGIRAPALTHDDQAYKGLDGPTTSQQERSTDEADSLLVTPGRRLACGPALMPRSGAIYSGRYRDHAAVVYVAPPSKDGTPVIVYDCSADDPHLPVNAFTTPAG